jgi:hypothetical protein
LYISEISSEIINSIVRENIIELLEKFFKSEVLDLLSISNNSEIKFDFFEEVY